MGVIMVVFVYDQCDFDFVCIYGIDVILVIDIGEVDFCEFGVVMMGDGVY